ncbi:mitochondrial carrier protein [Trypanosoma rangeli]|uniref:Mitochondrial carrier protein n=1 Tax=Trypanosoma rangeli TaxID=5698 RepID=A0A3R7KGU8_TRYRA|nr:mitochondrial carrier protein [Trypanosoma rangeli]RNF06240.1 mitochondrial carrier protein [Trypanosoma rangeli]|eukprot:RNF06240.1 mitochondrial carrier protein [Trypanosoma rangeli]
MTDFVAGWMGGVSVLLVGHPFDTIKVWQQSRNTLGLTSFTTAPGEKSLAAVMELYHTKGVRAFYKGLCAPMCAVGFANSALFGTYGLIVNFFVCNEASQFYYNDERHVAVKYANRHANEEKASGHTYQKQNLSAHFRTGGGLSAFENFVASTGGGVAYSTIMNPFELVKIRLQTEHLFPHRQYLGTLHCARRLYEHGGIKYFFKGYSATLIRDIPGAGVYLFSYSSLIQLLGKERNYSIPHILLAGGCAGMAQWIVIFPLDTIKTRIQVAKKGEMLGWTRCARQLYNAHGFTGLYRGMAPALVRAFAANGAAFVGVEGTLQFFRTAGLEDVDIASS